MISRRFVFSVLMVLFAMSLTLAVPAHRLALGADEKPVGPSPLQIVLPLGRTAYQTNETMDLALVRTKAELAAGALSLSLHSTDGSEAKFTFDAPAGAGSRTEHLHLNGRLLRPGHYSVEIACDGATATQAFDLFSHVRKSPYRIVNWGRAEKDSRLAEGEDGFGYNLIYGGYTQDADGAYIRAGSDWMSCCTMGGAHQMDIRMECDWSDPYVTRGGTARVTRQALKDRVRGNVPGVHFYDEPGLTWRKDEKTGQLTPYMIPAQVRAFESAFGQPPISPDKVDPKDPASIARWTQWANWKLSFMDSAWKEAQFGVSYVKPDFLSVNQSQYGWGAFTDGYYFNVVRSLPITSGHGGYDDLTLGYLNPVHTLIMARARDLAKPNWYLPLWYDGTPPNRARMEQYTSFQNGIQGMLTPPGMDPAIDAVGREGVVESNKIMARLGTIFTVGRPNRTDVTILYSMSDNIHRQAQAPNNPDTIYSWSTRHGSGTMWTLLACLIDQQPVQAITDEDIIDGTVSANHKVVILPGVEYLDPKVVAGLEQFISNGGTVLMSDCTVAVKGAIDLEAKGANPNQSKVDELEKKMKTAAKDDLKALGEEHGRLRSIGQLVKGCEKLAGSLKASLAKAGIKPAFETDQTMITGTTHDTGDIRYVFAVNNSFDYAKGDWNAARAIDASVKIGAEKGQTVYDAIVGGVARDLKDGAGKVRFGEGQMKAWALTRAPIGGIKLGTVRVSRDFTVNSDPIQINFSAALLDNAGGLLGGDAPLQLTVTDPLGQVRYDLYRPAVDGTVHVQLPLAANDPAGQWTVTATDLLARTADKRTFTYQPAKTCGAIAGISPRAVYFAEDWSNIFRFARVNREATVVYGSAPFEKAAAERVAKVLDPWDVKCKIVSAADVNKPRSLSDQEAKTWIGWSGGTKEPKDANTQNAGFAVRGHVILVGTPEDNPLIKQAADAGFLPYAASKQFPGKDRGYISWQRDAIGNGQESITLIAYDEPGMNEAIGTMYEAVHGLDPLTPFVLPLTNVVAAATKSTTAPSLKIVWESVVTDRVISLSANAGGVAVLSEDGTNSTLGANGKSAGTKAAAPADLVSAHASKPDAASMAVAAKVATPDRMLKTATAWGDDVAIGYWGGTLKVAGKDGTVKFQMQMPDDIGALAVLGDHLVVGTSSGKVYGLAK